MRHLHRLAGVIVLLGLATPILADGPNDEDRGAIENLGKEIAARLDASEEARAARDDAEAAARRARGVLGEAERTRMIAEISVKEYLEGSFPQDQQTILGEIKLAESELARASDRLAWSKKMLEEKKISEQQFLADQMSRQKSEISLTNARTKMEVLQKFTRIKQTTELEASVQNARAVEARKAQERQEADKALAAAERRLSVEGLVGPESRAIVALDEAITLFDEGKAEAARARLDAAKTLWRDGQEVRTRARYKAVKDRMKAAADQIRAAK